MQTFRGNFTALATLQPYGFVRNGPLVAANNGGVGDLARCHCRPACMAPSVPIAERLGMPLQLSHGTYAKRSRVLILLSLSVSRQRAVTTTGLLYQSHTPQG